MFGKIQQFSKARILATACIILVFAGIGIYVLARLNAAPPSPPLPPAGLLKPVSLGIAPYQYVAYSGSLEQSRQTVGVNNFIASFVIAGDGCVPTWGGTMTNGLASPRSAALQADFAALRAAGGDFTISFGGADGTELAVACPTAAALTAAYKQVIDTYGAKRVDFDIEGPALADAAAGVRRAEAIASLQRLYPDLQVWVTLPVHTKGLTADGRQTISRLIDKKVVLSGINIMAMNYNVNVKDMGKQAISSAQITASQLHGLYPNDPQATLWKSMMITVMVGHNNTPSEIFTLGDATELQKFARQKGVGTLSLWSVSRDMVCPDPSTPQPSISCSGVQQQPYDFTKTLTIKPQAD